jgi:hypothetical protein
MSLACTGMILLALAVLALRASLRLELRWDSPWYHIPFAALRGGVELPYQLGEAMADRYAGFPPLADLIQGALWRVTGSVRATGVANLIAFVLFLWVCHRWLRAAFWLVGLIALTVPMILIHTATNYVDLFGNSFLAIGAATLAALVLFEREEDTQLVLIAVLGLAAAAWSKFQLVPIVGILFVLVTAHVVYATRGDAKRRRTMLGVIGGGALLAAGPYLQNLLEFGNPFWPVKVPFIGDLFPFREDTGPSALEQRPRHLLGMKQYVVFFHSLFEINHPTEYPNRLRWIIDQGNASIAFRMGGFWNVGVILFLSSALAMPFLAGRRKGWTLTAGLLALLGFVAILPQSHELRYYMFLPLLWAAVIGMTFPLLRARSPQVALVALGVFAGMFAYMTAVNRPYYTVERVSYLQAASMWDAAPVWESLRPGVTYCGAAITPIGIFLTGPTMSEFTIIDRDSKATCPVGSTVIERSPQGQLVVRDDTVSTAMPSSREYPGWFARGLQFTRENRHAEAVGAYRSALRFGADSADAWNNLGWSLAQTGNLDEAIPAFEKAIELRPTYDLARNNLRWATGELEARRQRSEQR